VQGQSASGIMWLIEEGWQIGNKVVGFAALPLIDDLVMLLLSLRALLCPVLSFPSSPFCSSLTEHSLII